MFRLLLWSIVKRRQHYWSGRWKQSWYRHFGLASRCWNILLCNKRHVRVIRQNFVTCTMVNPYSSYNVIYPLDRLALTNVVTSWTLVSIWTVVSRPVRTSSSKLTFPYTKCLCHINTELWPKASSSYTCLLIWKVSLHDLPNFFQNFKFACCSNCDVLEFRRSHSTALQNRYRTSAYSVLTKLSLAGTREELTWHLLVTQPVCCSLRQWHCEPSLQT